MEAPSGGVLSAVTGLELAIDSERESPSADTPEGGLKAVGAAGWLWRTDRLLFLAMLAVA